MCSHKLNIIQSFTASGPFRYKCGDCGQLVYREHPRATLPFQVLFIDRLGIVFVVLTYLLFPYLPLAVGILFAATAALYLWDVVAEPLKEFTESQKLKESKKNRIILTVSIIILTVMLWVAINET